MRSNNLIEIWSILIHAKNLAKNLFGISWTSVMRWHSNADMISYFEGYNRMALAISFYCPLIGMSLVFVCCLMQCIPLLLVLVQGVMTARVLGAFLMLKGGMTVILNRGCP